LRRCTGRGWGDDGHGERERKRRVMEGVGRSVVAQPAARQGERAGRRTGPRLLLTASAANAPAHNTPRLPLCGVLDPRSRRSRRHAYQTSLDLFGVGLGLHQSKSTFEAVSLKSVGEWLSHLLPTHVAENKVRRVAPHAASTSGASPRFGASLAHDKAGQHFQRWQHAPEKMLLGMRRVISNLE